MNSCIVRNKAFKSLAKELNISENQLELLAYEYNVSVGNAKAFLTDSGKQWLQEQLNGVSQESSERTVQEWKDNYSTPKTFDNLAVAKEASEVATSLFGEKAVVLKETADGKYELKVAEPVTVTRDKDGNLLAPNGEVAQETASEVIQEANEHAERVQRFLSDQQKFYDQLTTIQLSGRLKSSEIRKVAQDVTYAVSDLITEFKEGKRSLSEFANKETKKNVSEMSRAEILQFIGVDNAFDFVAKEYFGNLENVKGVKDRLAATTIYKNFDAIKELSAHEFVNVEGFGLRFTKGKEVEIVEDLYINVDDFNNNDDADSVIEREGDLQEHWQVNFRTVDVLGSMSQIVRQALLQCYKLDSKGNPIVNRFGIKERISTRDAVSQILRWGQGATDMPHMLAKLKEHLSDNPWISQIIKRLDKEGKRDSEYGADTDFRSQFWGVFNKHFQAYSIGAANKDGQYYTKSLNEQPALQNMIKQLQVYTSLGYVLMFDKQGVNKNSHDALHRAVEALTSITKDEFDNLSPETAEDLRDALYQAFYELGIRLTDEQLSQNWNYENYTVANSALFHIDNTLARHIGDSSYDPFAYSKEGIKNNLQTAVAPFISDLEDVAVSSFHQDGKTYQSYVTPSYLTMFMQKMKLRGEEFDGFIDNEFGQYPWFKNESGWRHKWLDEIVRKGESYKVGGILYRDLFAHKVQLNFNRKDYMRRMSPSEYTMSVLTEYFSYENKKNEPIVPAWYRIAMLSNKPSSEFIRFTRYADLSTYKENVVDGIMDVFFQELSRIQTTKERNKKYSKSSPEYIKNLDKNGRKFNFLPYLNNATDDQFTSLVEKKTNGETLTASEEAKLNEAARKLIKDHLQETSDRILSEWAANGILEEAAKISNLAGKDVRAQLENFIWNDNFAEMMILQMFVGDIALYKDAEDLQKRLAEIHAPGVRGDVFAVDYDGKPVSDGTYRTILLTDLDSVVSNVIDNLKVVFDRQEAQLTGSQKAAAKALHESILDAYKQINVADAQGYSSITSRRKKDFIMGLWSRDKESIYQNLKKGQYSLSDLKKAFNVHTMANEPEKPFCYSQIGKNTGVENGMSKYKVGVQLKNSEYLLVMADAILQNEHTGKPNLLRAIYKFMENTSEYNPTKGIDTIQFESTAKALVQGRVNLSEFVNAENGEKLALDALMDAAYIKDENGKYDLSRYNTTSVHEIPFEDWCIQQPVPNHFYDHAQAEGSQTRMIIPSGLPRMFDGKQVEYKVYDDVYDADTFRNKYEDVIAEATQERIDELYEELGLNLSDKTERNIAIAEILQREIKSSPRYGTDLLKACTLVDGEFVIPLGESIQSKRVEQLLNSVIKNKINKHEIAGGPVVQVSNFGTSKELNIRYYDKNGELLPTKKEFSVTAKNKGLTDAAIDKAYADFCAKNQGALAYYEIFISRFDGIEAFEDAFGNVDMDRINKECPELLDLIAYRIPTEDKYSMAPCKIVGFLPKEAGAGIMMPYEITTQTGCDFDVDKMFCMRKEAVINRDSRKTTVTIPHDTNTRIGRNNYLVEMTRTVLTNEAVAPMVLNPGGFEPQKIMGYMVEAYRQGAAKWDVLEDIANNKIQVVENADGTFAFQKYNAVSIKDGKALGGADALKALSYKSSDLCFFDTQVKFYNQNSAAASILAIFAVAKVAHATLEGNQFRLILNNKEEEGGIGLTAPLSIAGFSIGSRNDMSVEIDPVNNRSDEYIGKVLGSLVASAADAVKAPVLNLMNINKETVNILNTLVRLGMPFEDASLFLSQKVVTEVLQEYYKENMTGYTTLKKVIEDKISKMGDAGASITEDIRKEKLIEGLTSTEDEKHTYQVLYAMDKVLNMSEALMGINFATRFNSMAGAVGPLIIDNIAKQNKSNRRNFSQIHGLKQAGINQLFAQHPILDKFAYTLNIAEEIFKDMPQYSSSFRQFIDVVKDSDGSYIGSANSNYAPINFGTRVMSNRDLLGKYEDFYKTCLVMASGIVKEGELDYYVNTFPSEFSKLKFDEKYADNALIQQLSVAKTTNGQLYITAPEGIVNDKDIKEEMQAAWIDLLQSDKKLAVDLYKYCYFRGGAGFSPRTFMSLVPMELKVAMEGYCDAFRDADKTFDAFLDKTNRSLNVADLFVQNNSTDTRLVPRVKASVEFIEGSTKVRVSKEDCTLPYFMVKGVDDVIYRRITDKADRLGYNIYLPLKPLGQKGSFVELFTGDDANHKAVEFKAVDSVVNSTVETADDTASPTTYDAVETVEMQNEAVAELDNTKSEEYRAKEITEALGLTPSNTSEIVSGVMENINNKLETPITMEEVEKTKEKKNNC